eukprot:SAG11_NODE_242_length_11757_cov_9.613999_1_plen_1005_part_00
MGLLLLADCGGPTLADVPAGSTQLPVERAWGLPAAETRVAVKWWDIDAAVQEQKLNYEEQVLAFALQGLVNQRSEGKPTLMFKAGFLDFDWPDADTWWRGQLAASDRVTFTNLTSTLCGLVEGVAAPVVAGATLYENADPSGTGYTLAMALTLASQQSLLPVTQAVLARHSCLSKFKIVEDLRVAENPAMATRDKAWRWAITTLLPWASADVVFNLYHFDPSALTDPQSNATLASLDYAVMSRAFVMDLRPDDPADAELLQDIFVKLSPLFDAFGWARNEEAWTKAVTIGGGAVFCSFASPNLSFWALLPLPAAANGKARRLPSGDSGAALDRSKYYLTFETNEGDTPRIVASAFGSSWASPLRGSLPVAWGVDPVNFERFPALMDHFASTALRHDSFMAGVAGGGYVYLGAMSEEHLRVAENPAMATRDKAWRWAITTLLPRASADVVFNLYHFDPSALTDPQSNATLASLDYAVMSRAFVMDLRPDDPADAELLQDIFVKLSPLFDAFGWARNEEAWTKAVTIGGGAVFCSFASPNLSFWALLPLPAAANGKARRLPSGDSGAALDRSKYYLTFETNEGDTPRIVASAFGSSWASPLRGSLPVAWGVDPVNFERFPALMDHFASTALRNDSFMAGVAGGGYVYLGAMSEEQLQRYTTRVGKLVKEFGPEVVDTYGFANLTTIAKYSHFAAAGGKAPTAYVSPPLWSDPAFDTPVFNTFKCPALNLYSADGTPVICTPITPSLFYRNSEIIKDGGPPAAQLAARIRTVAAQYEPPLHIIVYGGLSWEPGTASGPEEFWTMLHNTMAELGDGYRAVGASEMARLARDGCNRTGLPPSPPPSPSPSPSLRTWTLVSNTECHSESYRWGNVSSIAACEALCDQHADCALWSFCRSKANNCTSVGDGCWGYPRRTPALQGCQRNVGWTSGVCKSGCPKAPHVPPLLPTCLQPSYERWMGVSPSSNSTANPGLVGDNYSLVRGSVQCQPVVPGFQRCRCVRACILYTT